MARSKTAAAPKPRAKAERPTITRWPEELQVQAAAGHRVRLTHLHKPFWPELGLTKGDLVQYYAEVAPWLLPHLAGRAMVMKRYPDGPAGGFFFQKRAPATRPDWIEICPIEHASGSDREEGF